MAERRMFAKTIIDSDAFLDMPVTARLLYYDLSMRADDDGFINSPKKIQRMIGASDDDLRILITRQFIIPFESGVVVIRHWRLHNYIQKDRYKPTVYVEEKAKLSISDSNVYNMDTECIQNGYSLDTQVRLGKDRLEIGKDSIGNITYSQPDVDLPAPKPVVKINFDLYTQEYNRRCYNLPKVKVVTEKRKEAIRKFNREFTLDQFKEICDLANNNDFLTGKNERGWTADFDFLLRVDKATAILEGGKYSNSEPKPKSSGDKLKEMIQGGIFDD